MGREERLQVVVPQLLQDEVLTDLHEGELGGHLGMEKTEGEILLARLLPRYAKLLWQVCG